MFNDFLNNFCFQKKSSICVIGDSMLDEYYDVKVKKISPEFPIPVMLSEEDLPKNFPGGAANVAYQFKNFKVDVHLFSIIDWYAAESFYRHGLNTEFSEIIDQKIPRKRRFYSDGFPTYRWDIEKPNYGLQNINLYRKNLYQKVLDNIDNYDVVLFSDYDKGIFSEDIKEVVAKAKISIVDPKSKEIEKWKNCTIFKPNAKEALELTGCTNIKDAGEKLLDYLDCQTVIITEAESGISIFHRGGCIKIEPKASIRRAKSVIGAGDCFVAFLAMALAQGMGVVPAAELSWEAGQLYVQNSLNKPLSSEDLQAKDGNLSLKILDDFDFLVDRDFDLVFTNGCFDLLHAGHISLLNYAKKQGDKLLVAVNSDKSVARLKSGRPLVDLNDRMCLLANLACVDYVVSFDDDTPIKLIQKLKPEVLVKGSEYSEKNIVGVNLVKKVVTAPMIQGISTTNLIEKIKSTNLK